MQEKRELFKDHNTMKCTLILMAKINLKNSGLYGNK